MDERVRQLNSQPERPVFGTLRSMTRAGLEQRTDVQAYLAQVEAP
jgi:hypothetical protein